LPVIFEHPKRSGLNAEEFQDRSIGTAILPYISDASGFALAEGAEPSEVWTIAKIFDSDAAELMQTTHRSTSPGVMPPKGSEATELKNGTKVLFEGLPLVLDHLAVCESGVWDKNGPPSGIRLDRKDNRMAKSVEDLERQLAELKRRAEAAETARDDAKRRADAAEAERALVASKEQVDPERGLDAKLKALADQNEELRKRLDALSQKPPSIEDLNAVSAAFHRADRAYQMLGEQTPLSIPGETSVSYRRRLAHGLRRFTKSWKNYAFHDSQQPQDFTLVENAIYSEAEDYAKHPPTGGLFLRELVTHPNGKTRVDFVGDSRVAFAPFMHASKFVVTAINRPQGTVAK
jgi:hypothetical protein